MTKEERAALATRIRLGQKICHIGNSLYEGELGGVRLQDPAAYLYCGAGMCWDRHWPGIHGVVLRGEERERQVMANCVAGVYAQAQVLLRVLEDSLKEELHTQEDV